MPPLYRGGDILFNLSPLSCSSISFVYQAGGQARDVDPMSGYYWPTVYDAEPTLAQYSVTVSCLTPR